MKSSNVNDADSRIANATDDALVRLLCEDIAPAGERSGVPGGLLKRIGESARARAALLSVRARQGGWSRLISGVRKKPLWDGPAGASVLLEFQPGVRLPVHRHTWLEEAICLAGGLRVGDLELGPGDYQASPPGSRHGQITSCPRRGALAYLRGAAVGHPGKQLSELLGGILPLRGAPQRTVLLRDGGWQAVAPGVEMLPLWSGGGVASRYLRLQAGASLPEQDGSGDEECMIIEGEVFFGDLLLQGGDFLRVPAGARPAEVVSDSGALLFVHGTRQA